MRVPFLNAKQKSKLKHHDRTLWKLYRVPSGWYNATYEAQAGLCAICHRSPDGSLCVDHDHDTGKARGLLCRKCNAAIGLLDDSWIRLEYAAQYLKSHIQSTRLI